MSSKYYILFDTISEACIPKIGWTFLIYLEISRGSGAKVSSEKDWVMRRFFKKDLFIKNTEDNFGSEEELLLVFDI